MVSSLAKLCVHHMRLVRFPFLGLSVVTEAWHVDGRGVGGECHSGWGEGQQPRKPGERQMAPEGGTETSDIAEEEDGRPSGCVGTAAGVSPKGQRHDPETVWTCEVSQLGRCVALQGRAVYEGAWGAVPGTRWARRRLVGETPGRPLPPPRPSPGAWG